MKHALLDRLLARARARPDEPPSLESWQALLALVDRTYVDADQDRYTLERSMEISSREMRELYQELERRTAHELLVVRQSDERHRLMFEGNPLPTWVIDTETFAFLAVNEAMCQTYGYTRDELVRMTGADLKFPGDEPEMYEAVRRARRDGADHIGVRRHRHKDGRVLLMDITCHAIELDGRRAALAIGMDITRARKLEEELRQAQKMEAIGQLAGGIAHDFNNILAVIIANAEAVIEDLPCDDARAAGVEEIKTAAVRAAGLTRQLLTFSRKQPRQPRPLALNAIVTKIEAMLARLVGEDIAMAATISSNLGAILADQGEVEQVIMNLVVNARDAMPRGGTLMIETANTTLDEVAAPLLGLDAGRYVMLAVRDTGCGMSESVRAHIFEPFFTTKDVDRGTGLGLATVFGIVKQSEGSIAVESAPDRGSTFRVYWPRIDAVAAPVTDAPRAALRGSATVLVVEDDAQLRQILCRNVANLGYQVIEAASGAAALEIVRARGGAIDLVLTDLVMPGLDGRSLSELVLREYPRARFVFMSGYTEHAALRRAAIAPEDCFVQKPFSARALSEIIQRALAA